MTVKNATTISLTVLTALTLCNFAGGEQIRSANLASFSCPAGCALAADNSSVPEPKTDALETSTPPNVPAFNLNSNTLTEKAQKYKLSLDDTTWQALLEATRAYLSDSRVLKAPVQQIIQQNPALKDMQTKVFDAGGARVFAFPGAKHSHSLIIQSASGTTISTEGTAVPAAKVSVVDYPETVNISAAHLARSLVTGTRRVKVGRRKFITQKFVHAEGPAFLVVAGTDRISGLLYLGAYKQYQGQWIATLEPFSQIPSHFLENLSGQASFSSSDLVLAVSSQTGNAGNLPRPKSSTYQIVLHLTGGHYALAGSPGNDQPVSIVSYFLQCVRLNRLDLAKAWVADPALVSIPKYAELTKAGESTWKLVPMTQPAGGGSRFRLVTNNKHDLIFDVGGGGKKQQLVIKGIFIAPPDPLAKSLSGTIVGAASSAPGSTPAPDSAPVNPTALNGPAPH